MPYSITLRSRTDERITGWYDGSDSRWSTDHRRQKLFDNKRDARPVCEKLRSVCPRNAEVINIEAEQDAELDRATVDFPLSANASNSPVIRGWAFPLPPGARRGRRGHY